MTGKQRRFGRDRSVSSESEPASDATPEATADTSPDTSDDRSDKLADTSEQRDAEPSEPVAATDDPSTAGPEPDSTEPGPTEPAAAPASASADPSTDEDDPSATTPATRARPTRRATPAASAASRARRIGGVRTGAATGSGAGSGAASASETDTTETRSTSRVTTTKTASRPSGAARASGSGRTASAKALRDEARTSSAGGATVVTQVPGWLRWAPAVVLGACAIAMAIVLAVSSHGVWWSTPSAAATRDQVLAAAKQCTARTNTYAWNTIAADEKKGKACTTGAQSGRYVSAMENIVKPTAPKLHASQTVQINTAGVESISPNGSQWTVVIFGQTTIRQTGASARVDPFSTVVRMDHVRGKWLISSICLITAPSGTQAASC